MEVDICKIPYVYMDIQKKSNKTIVPLNSIYHKFFKIFPMLPQNTFSDYDSADIDCNERVHLCIIA